MSKSSKIKATIADLRKITVSVVVDTVQGVVSDCQQRKYSLGEQLGAFTTVGDVVRHADVANDEFIIGDIVGAVLGRMTNLVTRKHGLEPMLLSVEETLAICGVTDPLHRPAIERAMRVLSTTASN